MTRVRPIQGGLGAIDLSVVFDAIAASTSAIDPAMPDVLRMVRHAIEFERRPGGLLDPRKPSTFNVGKVKTALELYMNVRRNPWVLYAIPAGVLAIAYLLGRSSR